MSFTSRHILTLGRLLLVVFILANSGFTLVLYECKMSDAPPQMACCGEPIPASSDACGDMGSPKPATANPAAISTPCMVMTIAGGLQTDPKFVEKASIDRQVTKIDFMPVEASAPSNGPKPNGPFCLISTAVSRVSPPSVEKYVLTASFLI